MMGVLYLPNNLFDDFQFEPKAMDPKNYDSVIPQWNSLLSDNNPEFIQLNQILGPESIAIGPNKMIYTGLADGRIVELDPSKKYNLRKVLKFKESTDCLDNVATKADECGRFLLVKFQNGTLYALEANTGIYKIDIKKGSKTFVGPMKSLDKINLYNSFTFDPVEPNLVYLTVSSTKWSLLKIMYSALELDATGKIIALDINSGKRVVLADKLQMANGIDVDSKRDQLVFSETMQSQVGRFMLKNVRSAFKTAKDGDNISSSLLRQNLIELVPGNPDNIVIKGDLAYIAVPFPKKNGLELVDHLSTMPRVRLVFAKLVYGVGKILDYTNKNLFPHPLLVSTAAECISGHLFYRLMPTDKSAVIEYNLATGSSRLFGSNTFGFVSEAHPDGDGHLLLGSFRSPFLVKVKV